MLRKYIPFLALLAHLPGSCLAADDSIHEDNVLPLVGSSSTSSISSISSMVLEADVSSSSSASLSEGAEATLCDLLEKKLFLGIHREIDPLFASLELYPGIYREGFCPTITDKFPKDFYMRVAVVGGLLSSGLGRLNKITDPEYRSVYLINKEKEKGVDLCLDWTTSPLPAPLTEQFHVLILEQIDSDNLMFLNVYQNAYQALKPGGFLYFNTYRPSDYYINYKNLLGPEEADFQELEKFPFLKVFGEGIEKRQGNSWILLRKFFGAHLKKAGFKSMTFEGSQSLAFSSLFTKTELFKGLRPKPGLPFYNSGGWVLAVKPE
jgi:hypothetical protein